MFYINNYIEYDQFKQLYNFFWIEYGIKNINAIACKPTLGLTKSNYNRLKVVRKKRQKNKKVK